MKKYFRFPVIFLFSLLLMVHAAAERPNYTIWSPRGHSPQFAQPKETVEVEVRANRQLPLSAWKASLKNDLRSWPASINSVKHGKIHNETEEGYLFNVQVPADISPELFTLVLSHADAGTTESLRSISVLRDPEQSFYILQATDEHVKGAKAVRPDGKSHLQYGNGSVDMRNWAAPVINLINPRFVAYTGDNAHIYNEAQSWPGLQGAAAILTRYRDSMAAYTVPTFVATGNHDIGFPPYAQNPQWRKRYEDILGERAFSRRMGSFYVLCNEWTQRDYFEWAQDDYDTSFFDSAISYRLICQHFFDGLNKLTTLPDEMFPCDLEIVGHNHKISTLQNDPYVVLSSVTSQGYNRVSYFEFKKSQNGWTCPQADNGRRAMDVFPLFDDWGHNRKVSESFARPNDGTAQSNRALIHNGIEQDFYDGRVRFLMAQGDYAVNGGEILSQYDYGQGHTAVLVKVDIKPSADVAVEISRKDSK